MKKTASFVAGLLAVTLIVSSIPFRVRAAATATGQYGPDVTFTMYDENGDGSYDTAVLSGTGRTYFSTEITDRIDSSVTKIVIEEGITRIGTQSFVNMLNITTVELPSTLETIDSKAFYDCESLKYINLPEGLTTIGAFCFGYCGLEEVTIPTTVSSIQRETFYYCSNLKTVNIPETVTSIGTEAFYDCSSLESINIPNGVTNIDQPCTNCPRRLAADTEQK